ncbi:hypothetical protein X798_07043 [Onchocerca flexuosa]|uniref:Uncharacterized protein n=1 Tax=Onchocerca flexuosa TaxID=387005 RepID=A0A238BMY0_9BILA|nr:hypothetical protein X798_07043 [Onchocerca flexuosa]
MEENTRNGGMASDIHLAQQQKKEYSALCMKQYEVKQGKDNENGEGINENIKTVAAMIVDDDIRKTYIVCKEVRLINPEELKNTIHA